jgi:predicted small lipoprotein YifL
MVSKRSGVICLAAGAVVTLAGCGAAVPADAPPPAIVTPIEGSQVQRLQLTERAVQRLGIATEPVRAVGTSAGRAGAGKTIPYAAVVYDTDGSTWTYVNTAPRTYVRQRIAITRIQGSVAVLSSGPAVGAAVVTVGAAELLGTEYDISGEE